MLSAYAPQRGSRLSGKTREGISQGQQVKNLGGQGCAAKISSYGKVVRRDEPFVILFGSVSPVSMPDIGAVKRAAISIVAFMQGRPGRA